MNFEPYEDPRPRWRAFAAAGAVALVVLLVSVFVVTRGGDDGSAEGDDAEAVTVTESTTAIDDEATTTVPSTTSPRTTTDDDPAATSTTMSDASTAIAPTDTAALGASTPPDADATTPPYPMNDDGTPLPIVVIFDTDTITVTGQVPSQAAKDRLSGLAIANSQFPEAQLVDNMVINPAVPITVGVRVIELNSARFPEGRADILPDHARELDRVVAIMNALPNISVLVVGHADQRGDDLANFAISDERARAVVNYLLYLGIAQTRLSSRAAGERDLLTLADDDASLALNRRTEFIFSGLLIE